MSRNQTAQFIHEMVSFFLPLCDDQSTLGELFLMSRDPEIWSEGDKLFCRIREKSLVSDRNGMVQQQIQYGFEEICAKTLYNLSRTGEPFPEDVPFWIIPQGFRLGRALGLSDPYAFTSLLSNNSELDSKFM